VCLTACRNRDIDSKRTSDDYCRSCQTVGINSSQAQAARVNSKLREVKLSKSSNPNIIIGDKSRNSHLEDTNDSYLTMYFFNSPVILD
jgi:hypothetical protein